MIYPWQKTKEDGSGEFTLPDELQKKIDAGANAAAELPKITEMLAGLKGIMEASTASAKRREDAEAAATARAAASKSQEDSDAEIEELMLTDPKTAIQKATAGQTKEILLLRADRIKREVFEDETRFKYYHGDLKKEVDSLINAQSIQARNDPSVVENCYKTVLGSHADELLEGKIKSRFAGSESSSRGTSSGSAGSTSSNADKDGKLQITDDVRKAAKLLGFTPQDYAEMLDKEGVGYV